MQIYLSSCRINWKNYKEAKFSFCDLRYNKFFLPCPATVADGQVMRTKWCQTGDSWCLTKETKSVNCDQPRQYLYENMHCLSAIWKRKLERKKSTKIETAKFFKQVKSDFHVWHTKQKHKIVMRKKNQKNGCIKN